MDPVVDEQQEQYIEDEDPEDEPLELRVRPAFSSPTSKRHASDPAPHDYLSVPHYERSGCGSQSRPSSPPSPCSGTRNAKKHAKIISRQLSNLAAEDAHFRSHRDSLELMRVRESSGETRLGINQKLMGTKDSFLLTRARVP